MKNIVILLFVSVFIFSSCFNRGNSDKNLIKKEVKSYLKKSIKNPRSYKEIDFEIFPIKEAGKISKYLVKHEYKAKDGIGTVRNEIDCFIYTTEEGVLLKDPSCVSYKKLYDKISN